MRLSVLALVIFGPAAAGAALLDAPPTLPQVGSVKDMCVPEAKRELSDYFRKEFRAEAFVDMQPISSAAHLRRGASRLLLLGESVNGRRETISRRHCAGCDASGFEMRCYRLYIKGRHFGFAFATRKLLPA